MDRDYRYKKKMAMDRSGDLNENFKFLIKFLVHATIMYEHENIYKVHIEDAILDVLKNNNKIILCDQFYTRTIRAMVCWSSSKQSSDDVRAIIKDDEIFEEFQRIHGVLINPRYPLQFNQRELVILDMARIWFMRQEARKNTPTICTSNMEMLIGKWVDDLIMEIEQFILHQSHEFVAYGDIAKCVSDFVNGSTYTKEIIWALEYRNPHARIKSVVPIITTAIKFLDDYYKKLIHDDETDGAKFKAVSILRCIQCMSNRGFSKLRANKKFGGK